MDITQRTARLFDGIDAVINANLGLRNYRTKTAARQVLAQRTAEALDGVRLVETVFSVLRSNWDHALPRAQASAQNFRWRCPQLACAIHNTSPEVTLERAFIAACERSGRADWSNQVPIISGMSGPTAYKRRAVDLVQRLPDDSFEFVELKVASDTPLYATIEILIYGLIWLLSRASRVQLGYRSNPILDAPALHLGILAPEAFYSGFAVSGFVDAVDHGIASLGRKHGVTMKFRATTFPKSFRWPADGETEALIRWFDGRTPIAPCD